MASEPAPPPNHLLRHGKPFAPNLVYRDNLAALNREVNQKGRHIRLLKLFKSETGSVAAAVQTFDSGSPDQRTVSSKFPATPRYAALSYSWGNGSADASLEVTGAVNTHVVQISTHLRDALEHLVDTNRYDWLWVDAICIDQSIASVHEKNDQVSTMRDIYRRAHCTYIWLGSIPPDSIVSEYNCYRSEPVVDGTVSWERNFGTTQFPEQQYPGELAPIYWRERSPVLASIVSLSRQGHSAWWNRLWVVQELVSARMVRVCMGPYVMDWNQFVSGFRVTASHSSWEPSKLRSIRDASAQISRLNELYSFSGQLREMHWPIINLLRSTAPSGVSNPLDRVYSLLGLADAWGQDAIPIDYDISLARLFARVVGSVLQTREKFDILFDAWPRGEGRREPQATSLPTWMPDFSQPADATPVPANLRVLVPVYWHYLSIEDLVLSVQAIPSDVVHCAVTYDNHGDPGGLERLKDAMVKHPYPECLPEGRTMSLADPEDDLRDASRVRMSAANIESLYDKIKEWCEKDGHRTELMLFCTCNGSVGLTPSRVREGDEIIIAAGLPAPTIVRPYSRDESENKDRTLHELVGWCHFDYDVLDPILNGYHRRYEKAFHFI